MPRRRGRALVEAALKKSKQSKPAPAPRASKRKEPGIKINQKATTKRAKPLQKKSDTQPSETQNADFGEANKFLMQFKMGFGGDPEIGPTDAAALLEGAPGGTESEILLVDSGRNIALELSCKDYGVLAGTFRALDCAISLLKTRRQIPLLSRLVCPVETATGRSFPTSRLAQLVHVWPQAFLTAPLATHVPGAAPGNMNNPMLEAVSQVGETLAGGDLVVDINPNAEIGEAEPGQDLLLRRASAFLVHLDEAIKSLKKKHKGKKRGKQAGMVEIPEAELPSNFGGRSAGSNDGTGAAKPNRENTFAFLKEADRQKTLENEGLNLLERVRLREKKAREAATAGGGPQMRRKRQLVSTMLLDLCDMIRSHFVQQRRTVCPLPQLVARLVRMSKKPVTDAEMLELMDCLFEQIPEWVSKERISDHMVLFKMNNSLHYGEVRRKAYYIAMKASEDAAGSNA